MKSFLYAWAQQNFVLMLVDKHGLSSCPQKRNFCTLFGLFTVLSFYKHHVNTTRTLGKGQKLKCKGFTYKDFRYTSVYWDKCQAKSGKLMFMANYPIVDWGPPNTAARYAPCPSLSPGYAQIHVHWVSDTIQPSHPLLLSSPPALNLSQHQGLFQQLSLFKVI